MASSHIRHSTYLSQICRYRDTMNHFFKFFIFRIISLIPTVLGVIVLTFIITHVIPGNPALILIGPEVNKSELIILENELGLNKPLYVQFGAYFWNLLHFNLGYSYILGHSVIYEIRTSSQLVSSLRSLQW